MKSIPKILLVSCLCIFSYLASYSQRAHGHVHKRVNQPTKKVVVHKQGPKRTVIVKRSVYRPAKVVVYHPIWHPTHTFHRRWVFFPKYNFYWDNWRQGYYYLNGPTWIFSVNPPPVVVNVNLSKEKSYELNETEDDVDDIYSTNNEHQTTYPKEESKE